MRRKVDLLFAIFLLCVFFVDLHRFLADESKRTNNLKDFPVAFAKRHIDSAYFTDHECRLPIRFEKKSDFDYVFLPTISMTENTELYECWGSEPDFSRKITIDVK